ncbi:hypothetical protein R4Y45_07400 [Holzapfeliella sp. He02]|uniref:Uncharacterized protein n=1 Tax=Holzapfeliella saturejae TaxID=3082953 RepID=A0ABU8SI35_9LACO
MSSYEDNLAVKEIIQSQINGDAIYLDNQVRKARSILIKEKRKREISEIYVLANRVRVSKR